MPPLAVRALGGRFRPPMGLVRPVRGWIPPDERRQHHVCLRRFAVGAGQRRIFEKIPNPAGPVPPVLFCCRQADHRGPHLADGVESLPDELAYWLSWHRVFWRIFPARYCGQRSDQIVFVHAELDHCSLPRRHPGAHSSQYFPLDMRWPHPEHFELADDYQHGRLAGGGG